MGMSEKDKTEFKEFISEVASQISEKQTIKVTHTTLQAIGVDVKNPLEMQQDFAHLRTRRLDREDTVKSAKDAAVRFSLTGLLAAIVSWLVTHAPGGTN